MLQYLPLFVTVVTVHVLAVASPGPDFVLCVRHSLAHGRAAGTWTGLGFALGVVVHCTLAALGLAVLVERSLLIFSAVKLLGAAYLVYMGVMALRSRSSGRAPDMAEAAALPALSPARAVLSGFVTNLLNPKAILYFLGVFTMVVSPEVPASVLLSVSAVMVALTFAWFSLVAMFFTRAPVRAVFYRWENIINKAFGGILVLFGAKLATMTHG